jgi:hypothetical protein
VWVSALGGEEFAAGRAGGSGELVGAIPATMNVSARLKVGQYRRSR